jgi:hypothetical protein
MQSFSSRSFMHDSGYYHLWITAIKNRDFFKNGRDKAFFIGLLQDHLSPRGELEEIEPKPHPYAALIDLLAYSLTPTGVHLLVHTLRRSAIEAFGQSLLTSYADYLSLHHYDADLPFDSIFVFDHLAGRHEALCVSRDIHMLHPNWRNDRYSSIGFYLDDRRGDWMRPYRLTRVFDNQTSYYLRFLKSRATEKDHIFEYIQT